MKNIYDFKLHIDEKLMSIIGEIDRLNEQWTIIGRKKGQNQKVLSQLKSAVTVQSVGASIRIEGSKLTDEQTDDLLTNKDNAHANGKDYQEATGYFETLEMITKTFDKILIAESSIKMLHLALTKYSPADERYKGCYKTKRNAAEVVFPSGNKEVIFRTAEAGTATENAMRRLLEWYHREQETHPIIKNAIFLYEFLNIHPFQEGNGHLSRLLSTFLLLKNGYKWMQYVNLEHEIETRQSEYYIVLRNCQTQRPNENITDWVAFYIKALKSVQAKFMHQFKQEREEKLLTQRKQTVMAVIQDNPNITLKEVAQKLSVSNLCVRRAVTDLQDKGLVKKYGSGAKTGYRVKGH